MLSCLRSNMARIGRSGSADQIPTTSGINVVV
jgi:hypothetical protein